MFVFHYCVLSLILLCLETLQIFWSSDLVCNVSDGPLFWAAICPGYEADESTGVI